MNKRDYDNIENNANKRLKGICTDKTSKMNRYSDMLKNYVNGSSSSGNNEDVEIHIKKSVNTNPSETVENVPLYELKSKDSSSTCWGCKHGNLDIDKDDHPEQHGLWQMFRNDYGKISNDELAKNMHLYFKKYIRKPALDQGHNCEDWSIESIKDHFINHIKEPKVIIVEHIDKMSILLDLMYNNCIKKKENGDLMFDDKVVSSILKVQRDIRDSLKSVPEEYIGFNKHLNLK
jgi:hypothetical protein